MIVNGVTLPDIPADVLAKYPNALILWSPQEVGSDGYMLLLTKGEIAYLPPSILGTSSPYLKSTNNGFARYMVAYPNNATEWILQAEMENYLMRFELLDTFSPVWANLDIYECTSLNLNTGAFTKGDIWFPNSETPKPPRYSIATTILDGTARQIMRLTDSTEKVKPEEFEPKLEGINIQLQELTVTATEEVQTITPPSGVYGFSKVIVEAVESSGTGGGGTPGEGEEPEDKYTSAENVGFGDIIEEETVLTYGGVECDELPGDVYKIIARNNKTGVTYLFTNKISEWKYVYKNNSYAHAYDVEPSSGTPKYFQLDGGWTEKGSWYNAIRVVNLNNPDGETWTVLYTSHDITYKSDGTVWMAAMQPEEKTTIVRTPVEHNDTYLIDGNIANDLAVITQKITGNNETMSPSEVAKALEEYYKSLNTEGGT